MPSPGMTASLSVPPFWCASVCVSVLVMPGTLVVVRPLAAVVPKVERRLHGGADVLVAAGVLGVVARRAPVGVHVVHRVASLPCAPGGGVRAVPTHLERRGSAAIA